MGKVMVKRGNTPQTRAEIAQYLVLRWAPGAELRVRKAVDAGISVQRAEEPGPDIIQWCPEVGLTQLLHEIGHYRMAPRLSSAEGKLIRPEVVVEEARAWAWAEWAARQENLNFDYAQAERCFASYTVGAKARMYIPLRMKWRYQ